MPGGSFNRASRDDSDCETNISLCVYQESMGLSTNIKRLIFTLLPQICGIGTLVLLPLVHFGIISPLASTWSGEDIALPNDWEDPSLVTCKCNCSGHITADTRHVHLRATPVFSKVLVISTLFSFFIYELTSRIVRLYKLNKLRPHFAIAVVMSYHSLYRTYWTYASLYNHEYYFKWYHQSLHCVLQLAQVLLLSYASDMRNSMSVWIMIVLLKTSIARMLVVLKEQIDVYLWFGNRFKVYYLVPDLFFFLSDVLAAVVCVEEMVCLAEEKGIRLKSIFLTKKYIGFASLFFFLVLLAGEYYPEVDLAI